MLETTSVIKTTNNRSHGGVVSQSVRRGTQIHWIVLLVWKLVRGSTMSNSNGNPVSTKLCGQTDWVKIKLTMSAPYRPIFGQSGRIKLCLPARVFVSLFAIASGFASYLCRLLLSSFRQHSKLYCIIIYAIVAVCNNTYEINFFPSLYWSDVKVSVIRKF